MTMEPWLRGSTGSARRTRLPPGRPGARTRPPARPSAPRLPAPEDCAHVQVELVLQLTNSGPSGAPCSDRVTGLRRLLEERPRPGALGVDDRRGGVGAGPREPQPPRAPPSRPRSGPRRVRPHGRAAAGARSGAPRPRTRQARWVGGIEGHLEVAAHAVSFLEESGPGPVEVAEQADLRAVVDQLPG